MPGSGMVPGSFRNSGLPRRGFAPDPTASHSFPRSRVGMPSWPLPRPLRHSPRTTRSVEDGIPTGDRGNEWERPSEAESGRASPRDTAGSVSSGASPPISPGRAPEPPRRRDDDGAALHRSTIGPSGQALPLAGGVRRRPRDRHRPTAGVSESTPCGRARRTAPCPRRPPKQPVKVLLYIRRSCRGRYPRLTAAMEAA
jgi:hypothetical protein